MFRDVLLPSNTLQQDLKAHVPHCDCGFSRHLFKKKQQQKVCRLSPRQHSNVPIMLIACRHHVRILISCDFLLRLYVPSAVYQERACFYHEEYCRQSDTILTNARAFTDRHILTLTHLSQRKYISGRLCYGYIMVKLVVGD